MKPERIEKIITSIGDIVVKILKINQEDLKLSVSKENPFNLKVYPNPVGDVLHLKTKNNELLDLKIISIEGKTLSTKTYKNETNISIEFN